MMLSSLCVIILINPLIAQHVRIYYEIMDDPTGWTLWNYGGDAPAMPSTNMNCVNTPRCCMLPFAGGAASKIFQTTGYHNIYVKFSVIAEGTTYSNDALWFWLYPDANFNDNMETYWIPNTFNTNQFDPPLNATFYPSPNANYIDNKANMKLEWGLGSSVDSVYWVYLSHLEIYGIPISANPTAPSTNPSTSPSVNPSTNPSPSPTHNPTPSPTRNPTAPSANPSAYPSANPSAYPSANPSIFPSANPSIFPSANPSAKPSANPSVNPSTYPSANPSIFPSASPAVTMVEQREQQIQTTIHTTGQHDGGAINTQQQNSNSTLYIVMIIIIIVICCFVSGIAAIVYISAKKRIRQQVQTNHVNMAGLGSINSMSSNVCGDNGVDVAVMPSTRDDLCGADIIATVNETDFGVIPSGGFVDDPFEEYKQTVGDIPSISPSTNPSIFPSANGSFVDDPSDEYKQTAVNTHEEYIGNAENDSIEGVEKNVNEIEFDEDGANDVRMWLVSIGFGSYYDIFVQNTFDSLEMIQEIENENVLDSIGITSQEHQVKIMKNIKQITSFH